MCIDKMRYIMIGCALALIALAGCKTPELSMDERISLPESGEMGMNDTTFVKPLSWDVFFQDTFCEAMWMWLYAIIIPSGRAWSASP